MRRVRLVISALLVLAASVSCNRWYKRGAVSVGVGTAAGYGLGRAIGCDVDGDCSTRDGLLWGGVAMGVASWVAIEAVNYAINRPHTPRVYDEPAFPQNDGLGPTAYGINIDDDGNVVGNDGGGAGGSGDWQGVQVGVGAGVAPASLPPDSPYADSPEKVCYDDMIYFRDTLWETCEANKNCLAKCRYDSCIICERHARTGATDNQMVIYSNQVCGPAFQSCAEGCGGCPGGSAAEQTH